MWDRITVVGCGLIGGSLVRALRARKPGLRIGAIDSEEVLAAARPLLDDVAPRGTKDAMRLVEQAEIVVLATPVSDIVGAIGPFLERIRPDGVVTDTGSVKRAMLAAAAGATRGERFVGGHPMSGREVG